AWRAFVPLRGAGAARLLATVDDALPSAARSAYELGRRPPEHASEAMIRAHQARVETVLARVPPSRVVRWGWLKHRAVAVGAAGAAVAALLLATERGGAGAWALVHPGERDDRGERVAAAFGDVEAHLVYPSYLDRDSHTVADPTVLEVPRGTSVELRAGARLEADGAALRVGDRTVPMERGEDGRYLGRFVARDDASLALRLRRPDGEWVRDASERAVRALPDEAPRVTLMSPVEDVVLDEPAPVPLSWDASDDVAIVDVDLVIRSANGRESRRRIAAYPEDEQPGQATGTHPIDPAELGLVPGDAITVWVEARDGDLVNGPNLGRSAEVTLTLASEATRRQERLAGLEAVLDRAIHLLADRLERPVPEADTEAKRRFDALRPPTDGFVDALRDHADELRDAERAGGADLALFTSMASRVRRLLHEERLAHEGRVAPAARRRGIDDRAVDELEDDVLTLDDLLGRARVEDAAEIARELESLRQEMRSLLSELRRTDSPEARRQLLAAIGRAQARLRELMQRLSEMGTSVPQEFMNAGEMPTGQSADALQRLQEAVQRGDLERADQLVGELERQIDQIARALGQTEQGFVESRFGPRERAMANAMDALAGLEAEQQQLSRRGTERRSRAARRALDSIGGRDGETGQRLARETQRVREALEQVDRSGLSSFEQDGYDRARQRLIDTEDALSTGDLGEARRMAEEAARDVSSLARDLDLSALMFPGHEGETSEDAEQARRADRSLRDLRRQLDEALPDVGSHLEPSDRQQMRSDLSRQREATEAADRLGETFAEGPDGAPLHPDAPRELRDASEAMQRAERALERGDPLESARLQEEAARRLTDLRERLENQQQQQGGGGGEGGSARPDFRQPVRIPGADQFEGPMEMRRRLLDAMREAPPEGYEDAVRRYYEGLLR
ncbi:MAG TPA: DUF4175 family protein, partial [Sandaracinaceae bacterium LLY-WYZ-13_1]|nr:DUF4175 family protein [Sandaracinaceae bacterium LLY-WYZ-13_1]